MRLRSTSAQDGHQRWKRAQQRTDVPIASTLPPCFQLTNCTAAPLQAHGAGECQKPGGLPAICLCHCPNTVTIVMEVTHFIQWQTYQLVNAILMDLWHIKYTLLNSANIDILFSSHDLKLAPRGIYASDISLCRKRGGKCLLKLDLCPLVKTNCPWQSRMQATHSSDAVSTERQSSLKFLHHLPPLPPQAA